MTALSFEPFYTRLADDALTKVRAKAWDHFLELGVPTQKDEVFQQIKLHYLLSQTYASAEEVQAEEEQALVFVNGFFRRDLSRVPEGVIAVPLDEAILTYGGFLNNQWAKALKEETDPFAVLNAALHERGVFLYVPPKTHVSIKVCHLIDSEGAMLLPRLHLFAGSHSQVDLLFETRHRSGERFFLNEVLDLHLEEQAVVNLFQKGDCLPEDVWGLSALRAHQKRSSRLTCLMETKGAKTIRYDTRAVLAGEGAEVDLNGVWRLKDKREAHVNVLVEHQAPHCQSRQLFKGVLDDESRSSFEGKILVRQAAQKTDAFQLNNNLLLSDQAKAFSKPNLEVFADDVKASHGATTGQIDAEQLFYLKTRGFSEEVARALLVESFCRDILDRMQ